MACGASCNAMASPTSATELEIAPQSEPIGVEVKDAPVDIADEAEPVLDEPAPVFSLDEAAADLPDEALAFLVRCAPIREVWQWLSQPEQLELLHRTTRGFQRTANALRQSVVRTRLQKHLRENPQVFSLFLQLWSDTAPQPHVLLEVRQLEDDAALIEHLPALWRSHGMEALLLTLLRDERQAAIDAWEALVDATPDEAEPGSGELPEENPELDEAVVAASQLAAVTRELEGAQAQATAWQSKAQTWQQRADTAEAELRKLRETARHEAEALRRQVKHEGRRAEGAEEQLQEHKRLHDRTARRLKSVEKDLDEASTDSKRLKRQLRHQQQLNEEIRKQLADVTARLEGLAPAPTTPTGISVGAEKRVAKTAPPTVPPAPVPVRPVSPLDQLFVWQSDGRQFKLTPRDIQRAIDRNDEDYVFTLIQSLDAMRENSEEGFRLLISRVREIGRYYSRVLTVDTTRVLIDASNVARFEKDRYGKGQLRHLLAMRDELRRRDCFPIVAYADASLPYNIDEPDELQKMARSGEIQMTLSGQEADELLAREARRTGAFVVTNDRGFHLKVSPDFEPPRISFRIYDGVVIVDDF